MKKKIMFIFRLFLGLGLLVYLIIYKSQPEEILKSLKKTIIGFALFSFSLHAVGIYIKSIRWKILLKENGSEYEIIELIKFYLVSNFFNHFLPTRFGGDIIRIADTKSMKNGLSASALIVIVERISGIFILFVFALFASMFRMNFVKEIPQVWIISIIGVLGIIVGIYILYKIPNNYFLNRNPKLTVVKKIFNVFNNLHLIVKNNLINRKVIVKVLFWGLILQLNVIIHYFLIGKSIGLSIPFIDYFFIISILLIILSIPISLNGYGVRETVLIRFFALYGINPSTAIAFSFIDVIFNMILGIIGGIIYIVRKK